MDRLLAGQDWRPLEQRDAATGRAPYAPQLMVGLILYGVTNLPASKVVNFPYEGP